ncbi:hypothetical protein CJ672_10355 [Arcobacter cryaerophilus gv. occultus]|uniref:replication initiation protein n=1 Tax=Aliarcobacter cryaerophilus TaxID=28198 RepID=UPI000D014929|nr:replication initiation protein [Aliarcobacter cryaerophilus]PRM91225.1 hypothetical protein CJ672_10355 [Arcobacter cryaerophilus gv. occultus]
MDLSLLIRKNNALTDGNIPDRKVIANKLVNALYFKYEKEGANFKIAINELANLLGMTSNSGKTKDMITDGLKILQQPIELRNFEYKGRGIKWFSSPFLQEAKIYTDDKNYIEIKLSDTLIEGLKQKKHFTTIDLATSNKFKTKYGIVIYEIYLRYKNAKRDEIPLELTYQDFSLDELNKKFGTTHKFISKMLEGIERGLKEIEKITSVKITVNWIENIKEFRFVWEREKETERFMTDELAFIKYIRTQYFNEFLLEIENYRTKKFTGKIALQCTEEGYLIDMLGNVKFGKAEAKQLWNYLFTHQNQIMALKQKRFDF